MTTSPTPPSAPDLKAISVQCPCGRTIKVTGDASIRKDEGSESENTSPTNSKSNSVEVLDVDGLLVGKNMVRGWMEELEQLRAAQKCPPVEPSIDEFNDMVTAAMDVAVAANHMNINNPLKPEAQERIVVGAVVQYVINHLTRTAQQNMGDGE